MQMFTVWPGNWEPVGWKWCVGEGEREREIERGVEYEWNTSSFPFGSVDIEWSRLSQQSHEGGHRSISWAQALGDETPQQLQSVVICMGHLIKQTPPLSIWILREREEELVVMVLWFLENNHNTLRFVKKPVCIKSLSCVNVPAEIGPIKTLLKRNCVLWMWWHFQKPPDTGWDTRGRLVLVSKRSIRQRLLLFETWDKSVRSAESTSLFIFIPCLSFSVDETLIYCNLNLILFCCGWSRLSLFWNFIPVIFPVLLRKKKKKQETSVRSRDFI